MTAGVEEPLSEGGESSARDFAATWGDLPRGCRVVARRKPKPVTRDVRADEISGEVTVRWAGSDVRIRPQVARYADDGSTVASVATATTTTAEAVRSIGTGPSHGTASAARGRTSRRTSDWGPVGCGTPRPRPTAARVAGAAWHCEDVEPEQVVRQAAIPGWLAGGDIGR